MLQIAEIDGITRDSLSEFARDISSRQWWGKEREAVSLYAFGCLLKHCKTGSVLHDPTQIGIEVRVPKPRTMGKKREVCKDLVIWPKAGQNCWENRRPSNHPLAVLEWKVKVKVPQTQGTDHDLRWLKAFSADRDNFVGYAVSLELDPKPVLCCTRVWCGEAGPRGLWFKWPNR